MSKTTCDWSTLCKQRLRICPRYVYSTPQPKTLAPRIKFEIRNFLLVPRTVTNTVTVAVAVAVDVAVAVAVLKWNGPKNEQILIIPSSPPHSQHFVVSSAVVNQGSFVSFFEEESGA